MPFMIRPHGSLHEMRKSPRLQNGFLLLILLILTGCEERSIVVYLYGPAKSCYQEANLASGKSCKKNTVYDKLTIQVIRDRQEVVYRIRELRLDESNSIFSRLNNCNVIDSDNFSCDGLVRVDQRFVSTGAFGDKVFSTSYIGYFLSHYLNATPTNYGIELLDYSDSLAMVVAIICLVFLILL